MGPVVAWRILPAQGLGVRGDHLVHPNVLVGEGTFLGEGDHLWRTEPGEAEIHVDRTLNVWGSGGAHKAYFTHLDNVVKEVFNKPLDQQPLGLCDMGCGNGALLLHLRDVIATETCVASIWTSIP